MTDKHTANRLRDVYLSVTDGDTDPVVEPQLEDSSTRELSDDQTAKPVGPAEHHGLDDAIAEPDPD